jgi:lysyl-tRNA synthetase, class II
MARFEDPRMKTVSDAVNQTPSGEGDDEHELERQRREKLERLKAQGVHPWPERFARTHTLAESSELADGTANVRICGRLVLKREQGGLTFATLQDLHGKMQIALKKKDLAPDPEESKRIFDRFNQLTDLWDFIGVEGRAERSKTGEPTIWVSSWTFLGKALTPPASKYKGTKGEQNWRKRYVDLVANQTTRDRFKLRTRVVRAMREYLDRHGFDEVETPILCNQASGALARPFISHHNAMDMEVVLRIAPETYLKRLVVGGYDRVYELARCFRNEGMDPSHLQDFTMLEFYAAYWNYEDNMAFTEALIRHVIQEATGGLTVKRGERAIDFSQPFPRVRMRDAILQASGIDIDAHPDAASLRQAIFATKKVELENPDAGRGSLIDQLYKKTARPSLIQPTFIVRHPIDLSPLARRSDDDPRTADRFQLVVDTWEVVNAYSELVDPIDQQARLEEQAKLRGAGDDEAMELDEDYISAMKYGMPPISGWGMGIDRFVALVADAPNLRDVVLFPLMKPTQPGEEAAAEEPGA